MNLNPTIAGPICDLTVALARLERAAKTAEAAARDAHRRGLQSISTETALELANSALIYEIEHNIQALCRMTAMAHDRSRIIDGLTEQVRTLTAQD